MSRTASPLSAALDAVTQRRYASGFCDVFAVALHEATGWPLALVVGRHRDPQIPDDWPEEEQWQEEVCHAVCVPEPDTIADVYGRRSTAEGCADAGFLGGPPSVVVVRPATREDVLEAFTTEPVDEEALEDARALVATLVTATYWGDPTRAARVDVGAPSPAYGRVDSLGSFPTPPRHVPLRRCHSATAPD